MARKNKRLFPRMLSALLIIVFLLFNAGTALAAGQTTGISGTAEENQAVSSDLPGSFLTVDVTYGYDNSAKGGRYLPLSVTYGNKSGSPFTGKAEILTRESDDEIYEYDYPVSIPAEGSTPASYHIPLGTGANQIYICVADGTGKRILQKRIKLNVSGNTPELFIGVLSDTPEKLEYLDGVSVNYGQLKTKVFRMSKETFPDEEAGLNLLDVVLISSYRIRNLSVGQIRTLMQWVRNGGVLILGTGERADDTLGRFAPELLDDSYDDAKPMQIDMTEGMNTAMPGNNTITIPCVNVSLHGGNIVMPGTDAAVISAANKGNGLIAVAAFDFTDIAEYADRHSAYVNFMFTHILGSMRMDRIASESYGTDYSGYWSAQSLINTGENGKVPDLNLYIAVIILYVLLSGPVLFFFLQSRGFGRIYRKSVLFLAVTFTFVIYLMESGTRFRGTFYNYATIQESGEDSFSETVYLNLRNPYSAPYHVGIARGYSVLPLTKSQGTSGKETGSLNGDERGNVKISSGDLETTVAVENGKAFSSKFFKLEKSSENTEGTGFTGNISLFENRYSGTVKNNYPYRVTDVAIVFFGKVIPLGSLDAGESKDISSSKIYNTPLNNSYAVASFLTGLDSFAERNLKDGKFVTALDRANLLSFYLSSAASGYSADAKVVAFSDQPVKNDIVTDNHTENSGVTLLSSTLSVNSKSNGRIYRSVLLKNPDVLSGSYTLSTNSVYAGEPVVLSYSFGNDIDVEYLNFEMVDPVFFRSDAKTKVSQFHGTVSIYNYSSGNYDDFDIHKGRFGVSELSDYISPGNAISIRYAGGTTDNPQQDTVLPMLTVVGRGK
jgi:hypothetical protein